MKIHLGLHFGSFWRPSETKKSPKTMIFERFRRDPGGPFWIILGTSLWSHLKGFRLFSGGAPRGGGRLRGGPLYNLEASSLPSRGEGEPGVWLVGDSCILSRPGEPLKGWAD